MAGYISKKSSWLRFFISFLPAAMAVAVLCILLNGPRLSPVYDFLLKLRPAFPISGELLIIDSQISGQESGDGILEPGAVASLLYTLTEMEARALIIQAPILGLSAGGTAGEEEILYRFDEEFSIFGRNIRNLFDGIRLGSVTPNESARSVGRLLELSEEGKRRLQSALLRRDVDGIVSMEKAAAFFGHARRPGDLGVQLIGFGNTGRPEALADRNVFSRVPLDSDGVLRRVAPVITILESDTNNSERILEHIVYAALKPRFMSTTIEATESASGLFGSVSEIFGSGWDLYSAVLAARSEYAGRNRIIPLDRSGAVIFELPYKGGGFRRIDISDFLDYEAADRSLRRLLSDGESLGIFQNTKGEDNPAILYDYALSMREELASSFPKGEEEEKLEKLEWIKAREMYFEKLKDFLNGPAEVTLVGGYEELIHSESNEITRVRITEMRNTLMRSFAAIRAKHEEVLILRKKLDAALSSSFCILGSTQDVEASALLANSILTGRVIKPLTIRYLFIGSVFTTLLVCFLIKSLGPASTLGLGVLFSLFFGAGFSLGFIKTGYWLDPFVPVAAGIFGVFVSIAWALAASRRFSKRFRQAFSPFVSRSCLRSLVRAGKHLQSQTLTVPSAIVAIKNASPAGMGDTPAERVQSVLSFQEKVSDLFRKAGGTITGAEEELVTACFGSPLERIFLKRKRKASPYDGNVNANAGPASKAIEFVSGIAKLPECATWNFGLDVGECTFSWTALSGYFAMGTPTQKARILSRMASRYSAQIVISAETKETLPNLHVKKLDVLKGKSGSGEEPFYKLVAESDSD
ncbi:MAG: hypothetical protein LBH42_09670 [Treponema sp.]|jgi:hypothetical protein|nr:hypothetical protein [Treponema sp.]